jgi:hypothetical protein
MGFRVLVSLHPAIQATRRLTFAPAGLTPAEHTSLRWTHKRSQLFQLVLNELLETDRSQSPQRVKKYRANHIRRQTAVTMQCDTPWSHG